MGRFNLHPSSGNGIYKDWHEKVMRLVRYGCTNRPCYHIVIMNKVSEQHSCPIEQVGSFDPMANKYNERAIAFNFERIQFWLGQGNVTVSKPVEELLGLAGFFPIHPKTIIDAWHNRQKAAAEEAKAKKESEEESVKAEQLN